MTFLDKEHTACLATRALARIDPQSLQDLNACYIWPGNLVRGHPRMMSSHHGEVRQLRVRRLIMSYYLDVPYDDQPRFRTTCGDKACINFRHIKPI